MGAWHVTHFAKYFGHCLDACPVTCSDETPELRATARRDHKEPEYQVGRPQVKELSQWKDRNEAPGLLPCHPPPHSSSSSCLMRYLKVHLKGWQTLKVPLGQKSAPGAPAPSQGCTLGAI